LYKQIIM